MTEQYISISPGWFWLLLLLSSITVLRYIWLLLLRYLRGQSLKTRHRLDKKLSHGLSPHTLKSRSQWKAQILESLIAEKVIDEYAEQTGKSTTAVQQKVEEYLEEIVPSFNVLLYFRAGFWMARILLRSLYTMRVGYADSDAYDNIGKNTCVIIISNHRSNFDPLIHIYMASRRSSISFSAGEWARGWPFRPLLHAIGFYIVRRDSSGPLYRRTLQSYITQATEKCIPLGLFVEGGLSRDGTLQTLKLGTLNYALKALGTAGCDDIVIIPAAMSYDKIPEDKTLIENQATGFKDKGRFYSIISFIKFITTTGFKLFQRRYKAFGYAFVNYGEPISMVAWQKQQGIKLNQLSSDKRREKITELGEMLANKIKAIVPVPPMSILAEVIIRQPKKTISVLALKVEAYELITELRTKHGAYLLFEADDDFAIDQGMSILVKNNVIDIDPTRQGTYYILPSQKPLLEYYARILRQAIVQ